MSMTEAQAASVVSTNIPLILGAQYMASIFDSLFLGIILCQAGHWAPNAKHDSHIVRSMVVIATMGATAATLFTWVNYLYAFVYDYGLFNRFISFDMLGWYGLLDTMSVIPVQVIFSDRSFRINGNNIFILAIDGILVTATFCLALSLTLVSRGQTVVQPSKAVRVLIAAWPATCTSAHIFITSTIVYGLLKTRNNAGHTARSDKIVWRVMAVVIESQLPATLFAFITFVFVVTNPQSPIIPFIVIIHPKIFLLGCMTMVNLRHSWRREAGSTAGGVYSKTAIHMPSMAAVAPSSSEHLGQTPYDHEAQSGSVSTMGTLDMEYRMMLERQDK